VVILSYHAFENDHPVRGTGGSTEARARKTRADMIMAKPPLDPPVADQAPTAGDLTGYDHEHLITYLRLLDADAEGADWAEVARIVLHIDPSREPERAWRVFESHLARAKWMTEHGYRDLLKGSTPQ
jgi:Uncharacterized conserved protein (DUF2285)